MCSASFLRYFPKLNQGEEFKVLLWRELIVQSVQLHVAQKENLMDTDRTLKSAYKKQASWLEENNSRWIDLDSD